MVLSLLLQITVLTILVCAAYGTKLNPNETEARIFLNQTSDKIFRFYNQYTVKLYLDYNYNVSDVNKINLLKTAFDDSKKFDFENFKDKDLKHAFRQICKLADENVLGVDRYSEIMLSMNETDYLGVNEEVPKYQDEQTMLAISPHVSEIIVKSSDEKELKHYWTELRKVSGQWGKDHLKGLIDGIKEAANLTGMTPVEFWLRGFNISDMEALMAEFQPFYSDIHFLISERVREKFGESIIDSDGLIPDHLFEKIVQQFELNGNMNDDMNDEDDEKFPYDNVRSLDYAVTFFKASELYRFADDFYGNLGFEKFRADFYGHRIRYNSASNCQPKLSVSTPNIFYEYCFVFVFNEFMDAYANMGKLYYAKEMRGLPGYYFSPPQSLDDAIGKAIILSASTFHNLNSTGVIGPFFAARITKSNEMYRLMRMAVGTVVYLPVDFVHAKVVADLLSGSVELEALNDHYWKLMNTYVGVKKPTGHKTDTFDFHLSFYSGLNANLMAKDFTTNILSYQIHKKLCELSGKYPNEPLYSCDVNGSKEAGLALRKMMKLGSSKPFNEVLGSMFPEDPTISVRALLEYYEPVQKIISELNEATNRLPAWKGAKT